MNFQIFTGSSRVAWEGIEDGGMGTLWSVALQESFPDSSPGSAPDSL